MKNLIAIWTRRLTAAGMDNAERTVCDLAAHVLGCRSLEAWSVKPTTEQTHQLTRLLERAEQGEPAAYLIGHVDFRGLTLRCDHRALIPRPETEWLVEATLQAARAMHPKRPPPLHIVDVGTGSGCIALALLAELPEARVAGIDPSADALALAAENARHLGLANRLHLIQGTLLDPLQTADAPDEFRSGHIDLVVANLPYIHSATCKTLPRSVRDHEPLHALDGGPDGLTYIAELIRQARTVLRPGGALFLEIGYDQGLLTKQLLSAAGWSRVSIQKDLAGHDRIASAINPDD